MTPITTTDELVKACDILKTAEFITVDTEFLRENTYWPKLCLIQVASDDLAVAIDPLADGLDLGPFLDILYDTNILKVFHAARQDLEIFYKLCGKVPQPLFDTQIAAMVCGFGDSVGYETLVSKITKNSLDKTHRYTDWSRRPLRDAQINYAIGDVTYLRDIYRFLSNKLVQTGRESWVAEEINNLSDPSIYEVKPEDAWLRLKTRSNKPRFLAVIKEITAWREVTAKARNIPRNRVMRDDVILEIAAHPPKNENDLEKLRGIANGFGKSKAGKELLTAVARALELKDDELPKIQKAKPRPATPPMAELLKVLLKTKCDEYGVAPRLVANANEILAWSAEPEKSARFMTGWRAKIFGEDAKNLLEGKLALTSHKGKIDVVEIEPVTD